MTKPYEYDSKFHVAHDALSRTLPVVKGFNEDDFRTQIASEFHPEWCFFTMAWMYDQDRECVYEFLPDIGEWTKKYCTWKQWLGNAVHAGARNQKEGLEIPLVRGYGPLADIISLRSNGDEPDSEKSIAS